MVKRENTSGAIDVFFLDNFVIINYTHVTQIKMIN